MTQERRQEERRRRRLANQQQRRQNRPQRTDGPVGAVQFSGVMGWMQRNTRWAFLGAIIVFVASLGASQLLSNTPPKPAATPVPSETATATATATGSTTPTAVATPTADPSIQRRFTAVPPMTIDPSKSYTAVLKLQSGGEVRIQLLPKDAPQAVNNFVFLAKGRFYDGLTFHRVVPGFVAQGGDPQGSGIGGPGYNVPLDKNTQKFDVGVISMAKSDQTPTVTSGSQFFITLAPTPSLQDQFAIFGRVTQGMEVVQKITPRDPQKPNQPPSDIIASIQIVEGN